MKINYYVQWSNDDRSKSYLCADVLTAEHLAKFLHAELKMYSAFVKGVVEVPSRSTEGSAGG